MYLKPSLGLGCASLLAGKIHLSSLPYLTPQMIAKICKNILYYVLDVFCSLLPLDQGQRQVFTLLWVLQWFLSQLPDWAARSAEGELSCLLSLDAVLSTCSLLITQWVSSSFIPWEWVCVSLSKRAVAAYVSLRNVGWQGVLKLGKHKFKNTILLWKLSLNSPLRDLWAQIFGFLSRCGSH